MYINLELEEDIREIFEKTLKPDEIIRYIKLIKKTDIDIEKTIIFFDEIQTSERAITSLKYFEEANEKYKIVTAGSLLGVKLNRFKSSFPVGKVKLEYLCPMSFKEFLLAKNSIILIEEIEKSFYAKKPLPDSVHNLALKEYKDYLCIGGMPKAVLNYINNNNDVTKFDRTIHEDIITMYIADMRKYTYTATETVNIQKTYESMPSQLAKENKKFKYSIIEKGATSKKFESPLEWLISSGLLIKCTRIKLPQTPLKAYEDQDYFKMYLNDIGLLNALSRTNF
jgi:predicted AAA+ superfamily ATPase